MAEGAPDKDGLRGPPVLQGEGEGERLVRRRLHQAVHKQNGEL